MGGDFAAFQSAPPQQANFATFQAAPFAAPTTAPPPATSQLMQPTSIASTAVEGFSGFQGASTQQPSVGTQNVQPGLPPMSAAQLMQQQPLLMQVYACKAE